MKNWRKAIGFLISGLVFIVAFVIVGFVGETPEWLSTLLPIVAAVCEAIGIAFVNPFDKKKYES